MSTAKLERISWPQLWLAGNEGTETHGNYYNRLYRDYCKDPFLRHVSKGDNVGSGNALSNAAFFEVSLLACDLASK